MKNSLFALLLFSTNLYSAADEPHPIIDSNYISKYSYNIENMDLNELKNTQKALKNHLNKTIAGAGLDVFEGEPELNPGFLDCENAVLLPHLGSASTETRIAMGMRVLENMEAYYNDKEPGDRVA